MPKYTVIITRDLTESTFVEVEASNADAASSAAFDALLTQEDTCWEIDDGSWNNSTLYATDVSETGA
jgi:hypothetical protein